MCSSVARCHAFQVSSSCCHSSLVSHINLAGPYIVITTIADVATTIAVVVIAITTASSA